MPELPEVETVRRDLEAFVVGRRVTEVVVTGRRTVRRQDVAELVAGLSGRRLEAARRRGKYLLVDLDSGAVLVVHLRMSGQLLLSDPDAPLAAHTHVRIGLDDGRELRFVDPRTFGEWFVAEELDARGVPVVLAASLGTDPIVDGVEPATLAGLFAGRRAPLKAVLLDQRRLCGIGNLYADEICFAARVSPLRPVSGLARREIAALAGAIRDVLEAAVSARGSSLADARYRDLSGGLGGYQADHAVYGRAGEPCRRCTRPIRRVKVAGRSTHFCGRCQR